MNGSFKITTSQRRGFSFVEILFAVMILGVGFIMLAAIFPVAIQQQQAAFDESVASGQTHSGVATVTTLAGTTAGPLGQTTTDLGPLPGPPATSAATVLPIPAGSWAAYQGTFANAADPRYAWGFVYGRFAVPSTTARLYVYTLRNRTTEQFTSASFARGVSNDTPADVEPQPVKVTLTYDAFGGQALIQTLTGPTIPAPFTTTTVANGENAAVEGAYLVIGQPNSPGGPTVVDATGSIYQLGANSSGTTWTFVPSKGMIAATQNGVYTAYLIGKGYVDPTNRAAGFSDGNRVISCVAYDIPVP